MTAPKLPSFFEKKEGSDRYVDDLGGIDKTEVEEENRLGAAYSAFFTEIAFIGHISWQQKQEMQPFF